MADPLSRKVVQGDNQAVRRNLRIIERRKRARDPRGLRPWVNQIVS